MKKLLLIISVLLFINVLKSQEQKDTLKFLTLSHLQRSTWSDLEDKWRNDYFNAFLKKNKLKTSCASCNSIRFETIFNINQNGVASVKLKSNYVCGKTFTKKQENGLINILQKIVFPKEFYNTIFVINIGKVLKC